MKNSDSYKLRQIICEYITAAISTESCFFNANVESSDCCINSFVEKENVSAPVNCAVNPTDDQILP